MTGVWVPLRPVDWIVILCVAGLIIFISLLPSPRDRNPAVPGGPPHQGLPERRCTECHQAAGAAPLTARHPKRQDCFRCHRSGEDMKRDAFIVRRVANG
jgi:predicted CXXCH cytochrome family protein